MKRTVNWTPKCFVKKHEGAADLELYKGHLVIEIPMADARMRELLNQRHLVGGEQEDKDALVSMLDLWDRQKCLLVGCEVVRTEDNQAVSLDDLLYDDRLTALPFEFASRYLEGFGPGKK